MPDKQPQVELISMPENLLDVIYTACRTCYSADGAIEIFNNITQDREKKLNLIKRVISSGHYSTIEHIQFTFAISNVSRALTHQLVRHRHASFSQKSQRYVKEKGHFNYITPLMIRHDPKLNAKFEELMNHIAQTYQEFLDAGIQSEDARAILPNAYATSLVMSLNLRELIHIANIRLCTRAQLEIRILVQKMCDLILEREDWLEEHLVPKCVRLGYCDEDKSCGRTKPKNG